MSGGAGAVVAVLALLVAGALVVGLVVRRRTRGPAAGRATFELLHTASLAAPSLRDGLTAAGAGRSVRHLRALLGTDAVALVDADGRTLAWSGLGEQHAADAGRHAARVLAGGHRSVSGGADVRCDDPACPVRAAVAAGVVSDAETVVGALVAYAPSVSADLVRATDEVAAYVSAQVALGELDRQRTRAVEAELRALQAQISPHFVYNCLGAIASFVRTDPDRARALLLEFAEFSRYAFRRGGEFTTLADELANVERYLTLEQARFGERLQVSLLVAPEVLPVVVPFLVLQPLVENAVRHGLEGKDGVGHVSITARDDGETALLAVEDDGVGSDPELVRALLAGASDRDSVGLANVDGRLRQVYGDRHGLVVETAPGAGTRVEFQVPKYASGVSVHQR